MRSILNDYYICMRRLKYIKVVYENKSRNNQNRFIL